MKTSATRGIVRISLIISVIFLISFFVFNNAVTLHSSVTNDSKLQNNESVNNCYDLSDHKVNIVTTEPGVQLEVLDWGGSVDYLVLLTGLGDNAHVYDNFAYQFTDFFHVIGITRRSV